MNDMMSLRSMRADENGGRDQMANFLATDEVPDTLFGFRVISHPEQYTETDLRFFRENPEAGGYYDMGEDESVPAEEPPVEEQPGAAVGGATVERDDGEPT